MVTTVIASVVSDQSAFRSGDIVTAMTLPGEEDDPKPITGSLEIRYVPVIDYFQYTVDGRTIDPDSVRRVASAGPEEP